MHKRELMDMANAFYPDGHLSFYYDEDGNFRDDPHGGDSLARFVVSELDNIFEVGQTYRIEPKEATIAEAVKLIHTAMGDLLSVLAGLDGAMNWRGLQWDEAGWSKRS